MGMTGFSDAEMALLSGLDAVAWVTRTRITYTDSFKRDACVLASWRPLCERCFSAV